AEMKMATTKERSNPLMIVPTPADTRTPLVLCLEEANKATMPRNNPMNGRQRAADAINAIIRRGMICPPTIKREQVMMVTTGQIQLTLAACFENEVVFDGVTASMFFCGLTIGMSHDEERACCAFD
ncbi:MAG: hypothetical protein KF711_13700, partial [Nitrospira sp.]|nr:hypothetical protein [Nitrospira sp.]